MSKLSAYEEKRNFKQTPEPTGKEAFDTSEKIFVVQRHQASHLHYDFRIALDGVLKSWAVPKGPSLYHKDKRLAVQTEDHPLAYANFEGDIPKGNYGAGHMDIYDRGSYYPVDEKGKKIDEEAALKMFADGHLKIVLEGKKLKGLWKLVRLKKDEKNWLIFKADDEHARKKPYKIEEEIAEKKLEDKGEKEASVAKQYKQYGPKIGKKYREYIKPMLAVPFEKAFDGSDWLYEIKWDGYRAISECNGEAVKMYSRNGLAFEDHFSTIANALGKLGIEAVLDGELVALDEEGHPDFHLIQNLKSDAADLHYYVFDLLALNGKDTSILPLIDRKELLKLLLAEENPFIHFSDHIVGKGKDFYAQIVQKGLEGMIAKKANSTYQQGSRSSNWRKVKNLQTEEAIICGYTAPKGGRRHIGALVLGQYYENEKLTYIGHTGTGFSDAELKKLKGDFEALAQSESPFSKRVPLNGAVQWLKPTLVCQVKFTEKTKAGVLRHPVYQGLRMDKDAEEVVENDFSKEGDVLGVDAEKGITKKTREEASKQLGYSLKIGRHTIPITNTSKIFWPDEGFTKGDVISYYEAMSPYILPHLKGRPLSLLRHPNGIKGKSFFHKNAGESVPRFVKTETVYSGSSKRDIEYIICNNAATLVYLANLGCIEINPWLSSLPKLDSPNYLVIDLDPSDGNTFEEVIATAQACKQVLDEYEIPSYCKTSGSTGLHIYIPLRGGYTFDQSATFAQILALKTHELVPDFTSLERNLKKRGNNIYIDYLQNRRGQTVASAYSLRPKAGATVSAPLLWKEVKDGLSIANFHIGNIQERVLKLGDLFAGVLKGGVAIGKVLKRMEF